MKQVALISHSKGTPFLQDLINEWIIKAELNEWKVLDIFMPSGGLLAIIYEVTRLEEIEKLKNKYK